jgi:hypothetical protein
MVPPLSGARRPDMLLWLPAEEHEHDEKVVGCIIEGFLLSIADSLYCPLHESIQGEGIPAKEFGGLAGAESDEDRALIGRALLWLIRQQYAYRFGAGKKGDPYRYYCKWWGCEDAAAPCSLLPIQASTSVGA